RRGELCIDVRLAAVPVAAKILKDLMQLVAQLRKHLVDRPLRGRCYLWRQGRINLTSSDGAIDPPYFLGVAAGVVAVAAADSSIPNVQCVSTFLSPDFALSITVQFFSRNFCVT